MTIQGQLMRMSKRQGCPRSIKSFASVKRKQLGQVDAVEDEAAMDDALAEKGIKAQANAGKGLLSTVNHPSMPSVVYKTWASTCQMKRKEPQMTNPANRRPRRRAEDFSAGDAAAAEYINDGGDESGKDRSRQLNIAAHVLTQTRTSKHPEIKKMKIHFIASQQTPKPPPKLPCSPSIL